MDKTLKNERFKIALDYLYREGLVVSEKDIAQKIGISTSTLSRIRTGKKNVGDETIRKMNDAFGGIFNMAYFRGENVFMLMSDFIEANAERLNMNLPQKPQTEISEDSLRDKLELIDALRSQIADLRIQLNDKDTIIASKIEIIKMKDDDIQERDVKIAELQRKLSVAQPQFSIDELEKYPFEMGSAEDHKSIRAQV